MAAADPDPSSPPTPSATPAANGSNGHAAPGGVAAGLVVGASRHEDEGGQAIARTAMGDARERTRFIKELYYRLPVGTRALSYFVYRYVFRLGFLDGAVGFYFAFFQALWFRMLVDAKMYEQRMSRPR
jgi:hypothetical protein